MTEFAAGIDGGGTKTSIVLLDENGNIMAVGSDYVDETVEAGEEYQGTIDIYEDKELLSRVSGAAMFVDSVK